MQSESFVLNEEEVRALVSKYKRVKDTKGLGYSYGTAGFRGDASTLDSVCVRMGMFVALRARACVDTSSNEDEKVARSQACGVVLTASHNPERDNGLKIVDPDGGMLSQDWEDAANQVANAEEDGVLGLLKSIAEEKGVSWDIVPVVFVGRDTRESSPELMDLLVKGLEALGAQVTNYGEVCTPQLHYCVLQKNKRLSDTLDTYYANLSTSFATLYGNLDEKRVPLVVDCANGVGRVSMTEFKKRLDQHIHFNLINTGNKNLNHLVGAEHVQKSKALPQGAPKEGCEWCCSLDGDADRLVYFYTEENGALVLIDGDKITSLMAGFINDKLKAAGIDKNLTLGIVQTAYANGASTKYIEQTIGVDVAFAKTGVKHLHHTALEYDVAVYFEANGHGTVLFNDKALELLEETSKAADGSHESKACQTLLSLAALINPAVGDAISDMLACEAILRHNNWSLQDWSALYQDFPSVMLKCEVKDRSAIVTENQERTVKSPQELQLRIDAICGEFKDDDAVRAFVRPSGTEDVVRIYAEASTQERANAIANRIVAAVRETCN